MIKQYLTKDPWKVIEEGFHPDFNEITESNMSIGNGRLGQRANFEEKYTGKTLQGSYIAGIYYPDKTRVGWWKNGYPEYFAKVLNAVNWIGIDIHINGVPIDLNRAEIISFKRELNMKKGLLKRNVEIRLSNRYEIAIQSTRFIHYSKKDLCFLDYNIKALNFSDTLRIEPYLDFDVMNRDSNYDEKFWDRISENQVDEYSFVKARTKKTKFEVCAGMGLQLLKNGQKITPDSIPKSREKYISRQFEVALSEGDSLKILKFCCVNSSFYLDPENLKHNNQAQLEMAMKNGFESAKKEHVEAWAEKWEESDIIIEGDVAAQQGIRFNIFHLNQTYTGEDPRLNIGPKGFTGEKYGGSTYWDTEAYCIPFYLSTAKQEVSRNLLVYRYKHLQKAIENAEKLGFQDGAALYPMVTMNGEECHNEWEITFEEIHRNGAIAYAIYNYILYTGDHKYILEYGLEVLIGIARFWAQRAHWSEYRNKYVILGVTGPNEYENNVNNNWYTNYIASWCLEYTAEMIAKSQSEDPGRLNSILEKLAFQQSEVNHWKEIREKMHFPYDENLGIYLQQDNYLDKEQILVSELDKKHLPLVQKWSWDRILRSCFIKQADVLQGMYFFEDRFTKEEIRRNFIFYEPRTVHESSLSPCIHAILAATIGLFEKAYEMYLRTSRLDLDDYNNDTEDGLHITSMAGTWMSVVQGFGGMRIKEDGLHFSPFIPNQWKSYRFKINYRGRQLAVIVDQEKTEILNHGHPVKLWIYGQEYDVNESVLVEHSNLQKSPN